MKDNHSMIWVLAVLFFAASIWFTAFASAEGPIGPIGGDFDDSSNPNSPTFIDNLVGTSSPAPSAAPSAPPPAQKQQILSFYDFGQTSSAAGYGGYAGPITGFKPLDSAVVMISRFFFIPSLNNPAVAVGFLKFMLFILLFTLFRFALGKPGIFEPKVVNILSFVIATIGVVFMPVQAVIAQGGLIAALARLIFPLMIAGYAIYYAFFSGNFDDGAANFFGVLVLLIALWMVTTYINIEAYAGVGSGALGMALLVPKQRLSEFFKFRGMR